MRVFELHFNPKLKDDLFFDSFVYEPTNIYEKRLGGLYMVGELKNALPNSSKFLNNLSQKIKEEYFKISHKDSERALSESLKKANEFLQEEVKKENIAWLGNLNSAVLAIKEPRLVFSKTGDIKILLIRGGQITEVSKTLDMEEIEPYPLKVFFHIVSGKLLINDIILVLTKEIYNLFREENILKKIAQAKSITENNLKEIFPSSILSETKKEISGVCLLGIIEEPEKSLRKPQSLKKKKEAIIFRKPKELVFSEIVKKILPLKNNLGNLGKSIKSFKFNKFSKFKKPIKPKKDIKKQKKVSKTKKEKKEIFHLSLKELINSPSIKRKIVLIVALLILLFLGYLIF